MGTLTYESKFHCDCFVPPYSWEAWCCQVVPVLDYTKGMLPLPLLRSFCAGLLAHIPKVHVHDCDV